MSVRIEDRTPELHLDIGRKTDLFLRFLLDDVHGHSERFTPKKDGDLRGNVKKIVTAGSGSSKGVISWNMKYAAAQEAGVIRGRPVRNYTTPGTGPKYALKGVRKALLRSESTMKKARLI